MFEITIKSLEKLKSYIKYTDEHYAMPQGVETQRKILQTDKETIEDYDKAIKALERQRWIPVSERMPEEKCQTFYGWGCDGENAHMVSDDVFITVKNDIGETYVDIAYSENGRFKEYDGHTVIAWMPFVEPEPYKEENK